MFTPKNNIPINELVFTLLFGDEMPKHKVEKPMFKPAAPKQSANNLRHFEDVLNELIREEERIENEEASKKENLVFKCSCGHGRASAAPVIDRVIFQGTATVVFWKDGTKTVVRTQNGETFDKEKGLAMAFVKKVCGNTRDYYNIFIENCQDEEAEPIAEPTESVEITEKKEAEKVKEPAKRANKKAK